MPKTSGEQTFMNTLNGNRPILDAYGRIATISYTPYIVAKTSAYTCTAADSGTIFTTVGATAAVTFTLPAISTGPWCYKFICGANVGMTVAAGTADTMLTMNDLAADSIAFNTTAERIGGMVEVYCDGTTLIGLARIATEAQTPTITTA
jgi:hypothetical protein